MPTLRLARIEDVVVVAHIHIDTWRTTYAGIVPDEYLASLTYERSQANWSRQLSVPQGQTHVFVAESQLGRVVGFACGGPVRDTLAGADGELYAIYVLKSSQGLGYGKLLVTGVARDLAQRGYKSMAVWVLKDNPACRFYEKIGGRKMADKSVEIGGKHLPELAYVWPDLTGFTSEGSPTDTA